mmetsp:Transcript_94996/g.307330  ORF Transcript_94996/g.307330 Transcript_94996/m.307330 type:complete len:205 (-) Transcript_94996:69-683(-)
MITLSKKPKPTNGMAVRTNSLRICTPSGRANASELEEASKEEAASPVAAAFSAAPAAPAALENVRAHPAAVLESTDEASCAQRAGSAPLLVELAASLLVPLLTESGGDEAEADDDDRTNSRRPSRVAAATEAPPKEEEGRHTVAESAVARAEDEEEVRLLDDSGGTAKVLSELLQPPCPSRAKARRGACRAGREAAMGTGLLEA